MTKKVTGENDVNKSKVAIIDYKNVPTEWQLNELFDYESYTDPKIERDIKKGIREIKKFAKNWSNREDWLTKSSVLRSALDEYIAPTSALAPMYYLGLLSTKETTNTELQALDAKYSDQISKAAEAVQFFTLKLGKVDKTTQKKFLKAKVLSDYKFWLKELFDSAKHDLTESEERIISRYARPKGSLWIETLQKTLNQKTVLYQGEELPHAKAGAMVALERNKKKRRSLNDSLYEVYAELADIAEGSLNAILLNRKISNELRGYKKPYSATVKSYQNTEKEVEDLVAIVKENYKIAHQYYRFKAEVMGIDDFEYADRNVDIGKVKQKYTYGESLQVVGDVLAKFDESAVAAYNSMITSGQYDAYPAVGKRGGAFQAGQSTQPTMVFLNHVDGFNSMMTIAHETGHALHTHFTQQNQPLQYQSYPISTAEVASTFFENLVFYDQLDQLSDKDKFIALMGKMNNAINTIQRQVALFEIERELHEKINTDGHVSGKTMKEILLSEFRNQLGPDVAVDDKIGNFAFVMAQAHFASPFYVYAYAYGELIAQALHRIYQHDKVKGKQAVISFMSSGSSAKPKDIFKKSGITVGPELWQEGLDVMKSDLRKLKRLYRKLNK